MLLANAMEVLNYTAHDVLLVDPDDGTETLIEREPDAPIRLDTTRKRLGKFLYKVTFGEPRNMPVERPGIYLIVSSPVKLAFPDRIDLVTPNEQIRDYKGNVIGCKSFAL